MEQSVSWCWPAHGATGSKLGRKRPKVFTSNHRFPNIWHHPLLFTQTTAHKLTEGHFCQRLTREENFENKSVRQTILYFESRLSPRWIFRKPTGNTTHWVSTYCDLQASFGLAHCCALFLRNIWVIWKIITEIQIAMTEIIKLSNELSLHVNVCTDHFLPWIEYTNINGIERRIWCRIVNSKAICNLLSEEDHSTGYGLRTQLPNWGLGVPRSLAKWLLMMLG